MECRYQSMFFENMWKYVTRRFRDTLERGANQFDRCSSTVVNNGAVNFCEEKNDSPPWWLSLGSSDSHQNENEPNHQEWCSEHQERNWMGAIAWENGVNISEYPDIHAGPPCKWLALRKRFESHQDENGPNEHHKWNFGHGDGPWSWGGKPWENGAEKGGENNAKKPGPPSKWRGFRCRSFQKGEGPDAEKWREHRARIAKMWMDPKKWENRMKELHERDEKNVGPPRKWHAIRCETYQNENEMKWSIDHPEKTWMTPRSLDNQLETVKENNEENPSCKWLQLRKCCKSYNDNKGTNSNKWGFQHLNKSWVDAITWSGAAVLGWYTSQMIHFKIKQHCRILDIQEKACVPVNSLVNCVQPFISSVNKNDFYIESISKIGKMFSEFTPTVYLMPNDTEKELPKVSIKENLSQKTSVTRTLSNSSSETSDDDLGDAMELYKSAASLDHPEALYNLGIYYGQGRGGLKADQETAIRLLRLAAVQGQQAAVEALKYLNVSISEPRNKNVNTWTYDKHTDFATNPHVPTPSGMFVENINYLQATV
ncbi:hypothetical protein HW555_006288 [Spodoptera exigua]|uniref:Uncharacterized protein n=1 Tax=Spodoptera exigua TaxID=7107 RepID=A0A835GJG7_SPOEX|nr:hypothetical protein HW555_006288 [Spodoptera exigua]